MGEVITLYKGVRLVDQAHNTETTLQWFEMARDLVDEWQSYLSDKEEDKLALKEVHRRWVERGKRGKEYLNRCDISLYIDRDSYDSVLGDILTVVGMTVEEYADLEVMSIPHGRFARHHPEDDDNEEIAISV